MCQKQFFAFQKQLDLLNISGYCCFSGIVILPVRMHLTACLVFCLVMISLLKLLFYSILADEASDCSNQEQLSLVIRYVDSDCVIRKEFLGFLHCDLGLSGKALAEIVLGGLIDLVLDIRNCCGQGYDGAAAVSRHTNGLSAHICKISNKAIYTHCHSHGLNLVIKASCNIQCVRNVFDQIKEISYFFKFPEPQEKMLINSIKEHASDSQKRSCQISALLDGLNCILLDCILS